MGQPPDPQPEPDGRARRPLLRNEIVSQALLDDKDRAAIGLPVSKPDNPDPALPVVIELNLQYQDGLDAVTERFAAKWADVIGTPVPEQTADLYYCADLTVTQVKALVEDDLRNQVPATRVVYRVWPDFPVQPLIDRSGSTIKADAAFRSYAAAGHGVTWAVLDSGIDQQHPHFKEHGTLLGDVAHLHRDFSDPDGKGDPLTDGMGHGTHVAGIIAGGLAPGAPVRVLQQLQDPDNPQGTTTHKRKVDPALLSGIAPHANLVSLKVLDDQGRGSSMNIVRALEHIRTKINGPKLMRVHGVNLSVGYEFDPKWFACGQSPLCVAVNRLVRSGVVVVVAAGNTGYGVLSSIQRQTSVGFTMTINDPGNAELPITVGAPGHAAHLRGVLLLVQGADRGRPGQAGPGRAGRADHLVRRGRRAGRGGGQAR
jgi:serine protease AprX